MTVDMTERTYAKPTEEVARALFDATPFKEAGGFDQQTVVYQRMCRLMARAAVLRLKSLGFLSDLAFDALKAEQRTSETEQGRGK